jgi:hypothetical protein
MIDVVLIRRRGRCDTYLDVGLIRRQYDYECECDCAYAYVYGYYLPVSSEHR